MAIVGLRFMLVWWQYMRPVVFQDLHALIPIIGMGWHPTDERMIWG
jgi:hypothetical protein